MRSVPILTRYKRALLIFPSALLLALLHGSTLLIFPSACLYADAHAWPVHDLDSAGDGTA